MPELHQVVDADSEHLAKDRRYLLGFTCNLWFSREVGIPTARPPTWPVLTAKSCPCLSPQWAPPVAWKGLGFPPLNTGCFWAPLFTCKTCEFVAFLMWFVIVVGFVFFLSWYQQLGGREEQKGGLNSVIYYLFHLNYLWIMYWTDGKNVEYVHYELYSPVCCLEY